MTIIRPCANADHPALATLYTEMQRHYQVPCPTREEILADLANLPVGVEILVALDDADTVNPLGFAAFSAIYPGPSLKSGFFLKEIFVTQSARGKGVGKGLIQAVATLALERGHSRVDWTADRANRHLMNYYKDLGAEVQEEKVFYRLAGEALKAMARKG